MNCVPNMDFAFSAVETKKNWFFVFAALSLILSIELGYAAWQFQNFEEEHIRLESDMVRLQQQLTQPAEIHISKEINTQLAAAHDMVANLSIPWENLLSALENAHGENVIIELIHPDVDGHRIEIGVQANGFSEISEFIKRLSATEILEHVVLISEVSGIDAKGSSRFVISASWVERK